MPSVFTIDGVETPPKKAKRARKAQLEGAAPAVGDCKTVKNPRTGCEMQLCYVGIGARTTKSGKPSRTGWEFQAGSSRCPRR